MSGKKKPLGYKKHEEFNAFSASESRWRSQAVCTVKDTPLFFATSKSSDAKKALSICAGCPVKVECFHNAMLYQYHGIWGGLTQEMRASILSEYLSNDLTGFDLASAQLIYDDLIKSSQIKTKPISLRSSK